MAFWVTGAIAPGCRPSIGIGGHLTAPPLPHHRAYGSVPRRFGGSGEGQFLHGNKSETREAPFGERLVQRARRADPPRALR